MKVSSSEYLLLAAVVVEVAVRNFSVMLPNILLFRCCTCLLRLLLIALALIESDKFITVYGYTFKLSCSTIFHCVLVLLLQYNCD